jgi:hypothetical protein
MGDVELRRQLEDLQEDEFVDLVNANKGVSIPAKRKNRKGAITKLVQLYKQGKINDPSGLLGQQGAIGQGLKFKRGRKTKNIEGKGFLGDLFRKAKEKVVEVIKNDPIGATRKAFELAQKGIKGAQEAKKMATQFGLIKPKPAPAQEEAKGSGFKRRPGRPRKNIKGGEFGQHLLSTMFHQIADPFIDKGKQFLADPATQQAIGIYKDLTGSGLKKGKNSKAHFKQALEEYKNVQGKQKKNIRKRVM